MKTITEIDLHHLRHEVVEFYLPIALTKCLQEKNTGTLHIVFGTSTHHPENEGKMKALVKKIVEAEFIDQVQIKDEDKYRAHFELQISPRTKAVSASATLPRQTTTSTGSPALWSSLFQ
jgi:hypothetical protein